MKGYKDSTKTQYMRGGRATGEKKIAKVMGEFKAGTLHSGSKTGPEVKSRKQAVAIAMSEAGKTKPKGYRSGGPVENKDGSRRDPEYGDFVIPPKPKPAPRSSAVPPRPRQDPLINKDGSRRDPEYGDYLLVPKPKAYQKGGMASTTGKRLMKKYGGPGC